MVRGKNINVFLMDGTTNGRFKATVANWTGVAYKIPRTSLELCKDRSDLKQSGVYFLFGVDDHSGEQVVYIGQAGSRKNGDGILNRLMEHKRNPDKDYWTEAIVFTTSNNSFGPTEISYLENRFCNLALSAKRYIVKNGNDPTSGNVTEEKESELEEFTDYASLIMGVFGHKVFEPLVKETVAVSDEEPLPEEPLLYIDTKKIKAIGKRVPDGFVVLKGSMISEKLSKSCRENIIKLRQQNAENILNNQLQKDILFTSPSAAASFVCGSPRSGNATWKTEEGVLLEDI